MAQLQRQRVTLTGFIGAPGVATYYSAGGLSLTAGLHDLWSSYVTKMPVGVTATVESSGDLIDDATGDITGGWSEAATAQINGGQNGSYAAPAGCCVTWLTGGIVHSHRVRGRTFIVPMVATQFDNDGTLVGAARDQIVASSAAFVVAAAGSLVIWSRPFAGTPPIGTRPANPARPGSSHVVTGSSVRDKVAVLRSRRD